MRGEFLDVDGVRLYCYAAGSRGVGEPIVLLHGFPTSGHLWREVVPLLPSGHRVLVLDLLGYGRSDPPLSAGLSLHDHARRLIRVLDLLGIENACMVGHGLGGGVAQCAAIHFSDRVSRLCLVDSVGLDGWPARATRIVRASLPVLRHLPPAVLLWLVRAEMLRGYTEQERGAHEADLYLRPFAHEPGRAALAAHVRALDSAETVAMADEIGRIAAPASVVWGELDPLLAPSLGERISGMIAGSTFEVIPGARHFTPEESPHRVAAAVTGLLQR